MASEGTRWGKLTQLMTYHVFCNIHRYEFISIVNRNGMAYKIRRNH